MRNTYMAVAAIGLLVVIAVAVALLVTDGSEDPSFDHSKYSVEISGTPLSRFGSDPANDPARGSQAPTVEGTDFDGLPVEIQPDEKPVVILFLAHWCPHCQNEVEMLTPWFEENDLPDDVRVVSVATSINAGRPNYPPNAWLEDWPVPVIVDDQSQQVAASFGLNAFPFWVVLAPDGTVLQRFTGELEPGQWEQLVESLSSPA